VTDPNPDYEQPEPTEGQAQILHGLRAACTSMLILPPDQPAPNLPPGALIAWYSGLISAAIDTLAARADLYAPGEQYQPAAATGYSTGVGMLFYGNPRLGMAFRLNVYSALIHPPGLSTSLDPATSAIVQAVSAAARMLLVTGTTAPPGRVAAEFRQARTSLIAAARYADQAAKAHRTPGRSAGSAP
jgi:hypothetical protein